MHKGTGFALVAVAVAGGFAIGRFTKRAEGDAADAPRAIAAQEAKTGAAPAPSPSPPGLPPIPTEVYKLAVGSSPTKGGKLPKVTIVTFSEFQCPFCSRIKPTFDKILETYKDDVQIAFKNLPLPMHSNAEGAAQAALAAHEQGKFWEMHDRLFANQQALDRPNLEKYAQELGLDMAKWKAFVDGNKGKEQIEADKAEAGRIGARGTPTSFVNGRKIEGALPWESFKATIDEELKKADEKLKAGTPRKDLYAALTKDGLDKAAPPPQPSAPPPAAPDGIVKVDVKGAPMKGAVKDALVTIVVFSDFQCPFCTRVEPTIEKVMQEYKGKVRVAWRDFPLSFHQDAVPAATVARVAAEKGKFWEMHAKLFANQQALDRASLERYAQELGLDVGKVKQALDSRKYEAAINADMAMGQKAGVSGTPASFVNGRKVSGAVPFESWKPIIDEELRKAEALVANGTPKAKVYDEIMKKVAEAPPAPPAQAAAGGEPPGPEADQTVHKIEIGKSYTKGPKNAALTVVVFSDFQCPFCTRVEPTLAQLEKEYKGKIRMVWKNYPLPFHNNAKPAAIAAIAAGEQGKFWEMHDKLFQNQQALDGPSLEKYAQELGLDLAKWKAAMANPTNAQQVDDEMKEGSAVGVNGTPATFINGRKIGGAYPFPTFKAIAEQELAKTKKKS
jgi:protein-disulfide isomerase